MSSLQHNAQIYSDGILWKAFDRIQKNLNVAENEYQLFSRIFEIIYETQGPRGLMEYISRYSKTRHIPIDPTVLDDNFPYEKISIITRDESEEKRRKVMEKYGILVHPIGLILQEMNEEELEKVSKFFNYPSTAPKNFRGLRKDSKKTIGLIIHTHQHKDSLHEEMHTAFHVYRKGKHPAEYFSRKGKYYTETKKIENSFVNELNSFRIEAREGFHTWKHINDVLINCYLPYFSGPYTITERKINEISEKINYICKDVMPEFQKKYDERVLNRIFLEEAYDLDDIIEWYEMDNLRKILDLWNEYYIGEEI